MHQLTSLECDSTLQYDLSNLAVRIIAFGRACKRPRVTFACAEILFISVNSCLHHLSWALLTTPVNNLMFDSSNYRRSMMINSTRFNPRLVSSSGARSTHVPNRFR